MTAPCEACEGEGSWFRHLGEEDILEVICDVCDGTGQDQFGGSDNDTRAATQPSPDPVVSGSDARVVSEYPNGSAK